MFKSLLCPGGREPRFQLTDALVQYRCRSNSASLHYKLLDYLTKGIYSCGELFCRGTGGGGGGYSTKFSTSRLRSVPSTFNILILMGTIIHSYA